MYYYPRDKNYPGDYKNLENEKNEGMIRTSEAFKKSGNGNKENVSL